MTKRTFGLEIADNEVTSRFYSFEDFDMALRESSHPWYIATQSKAAVVMFKYPGLLKDFAGAFDLGKHLFWYPRFTRYKHVKHWQKPFDITEQIQWLYDHVCTVDVRSFRWVMQSLFPKWIEPVQFYENTPTVLSNEALVTLAHFDDFKPFIEVDKYDGLARPTWLAESVVTNMQPTMETDTNTPDAQKLKIHKEDLARWAANVSRAASIMHEIGFDIEFIKEIKQLAEKGSEEKKPKTPEPKTPEPKTPEPKTPEPKTIDTFFTKPETQPEVTKTNEPETQPEIEEPKQKKKKHVGPVWVDWDNLLQPEDLPPNHEDMVDDWGEQKYLPIITDGELKGFMENPKYEGE